MSIFPNKPILNTSNYSYGSNLIIIECSGTKFEDHTTQNCLERHQDMYHAKTLNIRWSVSGNIHTLLENCILMESTDATIFIL